MIWGGLSAALLSKTKQWHARQRYPFTALYHPVASNWAEWHVKEIAVYLMFPHGWKWRLGCSMSTSWKYSEKDFKICCPIIIIGWINWSVCFVMVSCICAPKFVKLRACHASTEEARGRHFNHSSVGCCLLYQVCCCWIMACTVLQGIVEIILCVTQIRNTW